MYYHFEPNQGSETNDLHESIDKRNKTDETENQINYLNDIADLINGLIELVETKSDEQSEKITTFICKMRDEIQLVDEFPSDYFAETEFFQKINELINSDELLVKDRKNLLIILIFLMKSNDSYLEQFTSVCDPFEIFATAFDSDERDYFSVACNFFKIAFDYKDLKEFVLDINFIDHFFDTFNDMISCLSEYEINLQLDDAILAGSELFLVFVKKLSKEKLDPIIPKIFDTCYQMNKCPIFYKLVQYSAEIVYIIGKNNGFIALMQDEVFTSLLSLFNDSRCSASFKYIVITIIEIINEDTDHIISLDAFPIDPIISLLPLFYPVSKHELRGDDDDSDDFEPEIETEYQNQIEDYDLLNNILKLCIILSNQSNTSYISHFIEEERITDIINIYNKSSYEIRLQCIELLWSIIKYSEKEQALILVENPNVSEILNEGLSGDKIEFTEKVIDFYAYPFIDSVIKGGPFEYYRFNNFLCSVKETIEDLDDIETDRMKELLENLDELLNSIPLKSTS